MDKLDKESLVLQSTTSLAQTGGPVLLICKSCTKKFDELKALPCGNTVCSGCLEINLEKDLNSNSNHHGQNGQNGETLLTNGNGTHESTSSDKSSENLELNNELEGPSMKCSCCGEMHIIPLTGFPSCCVRVDNLIKLKSHENLRNVSADYLKKLVQDIQTVSMELTESNETGLKKIYNLCSFIRNDIEVATESRIADIQQKKDELIGDVDAFEDQCINNFKANRQADTKQVNESLKKLHAFREKCTKHLSKEIIDENEIEAALKEARQLKKDLNSQLAQLKTKTFNGKTISFERTDLPLKKSFIGDLTVNRLTGTFTLKIPKFSEFKETSEWYENADPRLVQGLPWKLGVKCITSEKSDEVSLGIFLYCIFPKHLT
jgi:hypothetical protein